MRWREVAEVGGGQTLRGLADRIMAARHGDGERFGAPGVGPPPAEGRLDPFSAGTLVRWLGPAATTPQDVLVAVWV